MSDICNASCPTHMTNVPPWISSLPGTCACQIRYQYRGTGFKDFKLIAWSIAHCHLLVTLRHHLSIRHSFNAKDQRLQIKVWPVGGRDYTNPTGQKDHTCSCPGFTTIAGTLAQCVSVKKVRVVTWSSWAEQWWFRNKQSTQAIQTCRKGESDCWRNFFLIGQCSTDAEQVPQRVFESQT